MSPQPWYACLYHYLPGSHDANCRARLVGLARDFSPRFECHGADLISIDVSGLARLRGGPYTIGSELRLSAAARGLRVQVALATTWTAAMVIAAARPGLTVIQPGSEAAALAPIAVGALENVHGEGAQSPRRNIDQIHAAIAALKHWGVKSLGALAALPAPELAARLGHTGLVLQTLARGQDIRPLVPMLPEERFESSAELEWPIEGLEPLSFVLTRLLEPLSTRLERRDRGAAVLHITLGLVRCPGGQDADTYTRSLQLPSPMRDVRTLRTLLLLDLESHPPPAAVERVTVLIDPTPGRVLQHTLFTRAHPTPEQLSTLIARLTALMGQDRIGRPAVVDSYRPGAFEMEPFKTEHPPVARISRENPAACASSAGTASSAMSIVSVLRRCRHPVPARVVVADGRPVRVTSDRRSLGGGHVLACAGPWRTSGNWWEPSSMIDRRPSTYWNRDEWDVSLGDGAVYRIFRDRATDGWFIDAIAD